MTREEFIKRVRGIAEGNLYTHDPMSTKQPPIFGWEPLEMEAGDLYDRLMGKDMSEIEEQICDKCGGEIDRCDGCGEAYCSNCDDGCGIDDGDNSLCSGCMTAAKEDWARITDNGRKVCETCANFRDAATRLKYQCGDIPDECCALGEDTPGSSGYCDEWCAKTE
ncbi:MAG: hypothetical protein LBV18_03945 [Alistipes sp.]|jgi:hypothetical protein|nr:hypothetical protein [Alistipes sp.]